MILALLTAGLLVSCTKEKEAITPTAQAETSARSGYLMYDGAPWENGFAYTPVDYEGADNDWNTDFGGFYPQTFSAALSNKMVFDLGPCIACNVGVDCDINTGDVLLMEFYDTQNNIVLRDTLPAGGYYSYSNPEEYVRPGAYMLSKLKVRLIGSGAGGSLSQVFIEKTVY